MITADCECLGEDPNSTDELTMIFDVYPNPAQSVVRVVIHEEAILEIYALDGSQVLITEIKGQAQISIAHLVTGIYIISVRSGNRLGYKKLIKL